MENAAFLFMILVFSIYSLNNGEAPCRWKHTEQIILPKMAHTAKEEKSLELKEAWQPGKKEKSSRKKKFLTPTEFKTILLG